MKHFCILLLLIIFSLGSVYAQSRMTFEGRDTLINFANHQLYARLHGYNNKVVESNGRILYVKLTFMGKIQDSVEYFYVNDSVYHCVSYFSDSSIKSEGAFIVGHTLPRTDTILHVDINSGEMFYRTIDYLEIKKKGKWSECVRNDELRIHWEGDYRNGKRIGRWDQISYVHGRKKYISSINYSLDSTKLIGGENLVRLSLDSLKTIIRWRWSPIQCETKISSIMVFSKCWVTANGEYGGSCSNDFEKVDYYEFLNANIFKQQRKTCQKLSKNLFEGAWSITKEGADTYLTIDFQKAKQKRKFKIIYLDREDYLILERK